MAPSAPSTTDHVHGCSPSTVDGSHVVSSPIAVRVQRCARPVFSQDSVSTTQSFWQSAEMAPSSPGLNASNEAKIPSRGERRAITSASATTVEAERIEPVRVEEDHPKPFGVPSCRTRGSQERTRVGERTVGGDAADGEGGDDLADVADEAWQEGLRVSTAASTTGVEVRRFAADLVPFRPRTPPTLPERHREGRSRMNSAGGRECRDEILTSGIATAQDGAGAGHERLGLDNDERPAEEDGADEKKNDVVKKLDFHELFA